MHALCKDAVENAQLGSPAASVIIVAMLVIGVWGLIVYLNPPRPLKVVEGTAIRPFDDGTEG